ncbi:hypothetical protein IFR05_011963 [Cadophora sp. M221]|nr:hypothetical protein IFR05_011963 [Cadophora sp. M221]
MKVPMVAAVLVLLSEGAVAAPQSASRKCCNVLSNTRSLRGKVFGKDTAPYDTRLATYYSANSALEPWCMVLPETASEVSSVVNALTTNDCPFGIRSGAHAIWAGSNAIKDGVTIDLGYINDTTFDEQTRVVKIGPGSTWGNVFLALDPYGVTAVGGRVSVVGVGGFTTGGGYSFHSARRGFACDDVANFEVVLADGSIVNANANQRADLFRALKGGSGNLGIVTRIDQRVVEGNKIWASSQTYNMTEREAVFDAYHSFVDYLNDHPDEDATQGIVFYIYSPGGYRIVTSFSNIDSNPEPPALAEFRTVETATAFGGVDLVSRLTVGSTGPSQMGIFTTWFVGMVSLDRHVMDLINEAQIEYVEKMKAAVPGANFTLLLQFQPVTRTMVSHAAASGGNVLGLEAVVADGPGNMWHIQFTVDSLEEQEQLQPLAIELADVFNRIADDNGAQKNWDFLNYANGNQDPITKYGAENVAFLKTVSAKYDRQQVFQKLRKTGFRLPA